MRIKWEEFDWKYRQLCSVPSGAKLFSVYSGEIDNEILATEHEDIASALCGVPKVICDAKALIDNMGWESRSYDEWDNLIAALKGVGGR